MLGDNRSDIGLEACRARYGAEEKKNGAWAPGNESPRAWHAIAAMRAVNITQIAADANLFCVFLQLFFRRGLDYLPNGA